MEHAEGLADCRKVLMQAKAGRKKRLSDRGYGLPRRMCGGSRDIASGSQCEKGGTEDRPGFDEEAASEGTEED